MNSIEKYIREIMEIFDQIGSNGPDKGVTRLGYSETEDLMHEVLRKYAIYQGLNFHIDQVGNTFVYEKDYESYSLIGSHLDSVVQGGRYDGVLGVAVGLGVLLSFRDQEIDIPLKLVALRCEEYSNFMVSMLGSKLITGNIDEETLNNLESTEGRSLRSIFEENSYTFKPEIITGVERFIEVHIEQGRILESENKRIGLVSEIAGSSRLQVKLHGLAEHSGTTPMSMRKDSLAAAAEIILAVEEIAKNESPTSVATVGFIKNFPNVMNVVPGNTDFSIDLRDVDNESMESMKIKVKDIIDKICKRRKITYELIDYPFSPAVKLSDQMIADFEQVAKDLKHDYKIMASGAGHDCMVFLIFVM